MPKVQAAASPAPGRLGRARRVSTALAEINVVPLVDVMLVLLIIFMITAPMIQRGIDVNLPVQSRAMQKMLSVSLARHIALAAGMALAPRGWIGRPIEPSRNVMTISLSGAGEGPRNGGLTAAPGQAVQTAPEDLAKREPARAPAAKP